MLLLLTICPSLSAGFILVAAMLAHHLDYLA